MKSVCKNLFSVLLAVIMVLSIVITASASIMAELTGEDVASITGYSDVYNEDFKEIFNEEEGSLRIVSSETDGPITIHYTAVADNAFSYKSGISEKDYLKDVKSIIVEESIRDIGERAFANLPNLTKITFEGEVSLGKNAFANCSALEEVVFEKAAAVGKKAFEGCTALKTIAVPKDVYFDASADAFTDTAFYRNYTIDFITLGATLIAYKGADEVVTIPQNIVAIGHGAFKGNTALKKVYFTEYVEILGDEAFMDCTNLESVRFSRYGNIKTIGKDVFTNTYFFDNFEGDFFTIGSHLIKYKGHDAYVLIPNTITAIAPLCFDGCYTTTENNGRTYVVSGIFVSASVTSFGENCFGLDKLADGSYYTPRIYAYSKTANDSIKLLNDAGYNPTIMPSPADVDGDGAVTAADARIALRMAVKIDIDNEPVVYRSADVDGDHTITADDARTILRLSVNLEKFTPEDLLYIPSTEFEILQSYTIAMEKIARYSAGYKKDIINTPGADNMSVKGRVYVLDTLKKKGYTNSNEVYEPDTVDAYRNIDYCSLISTKSIESACCMLDENDKYTITIKFKDIPDNDGSSDVLKVFPAQTRSYYTDLLKNKYWWNSKYDINRITKFDLTYTKPSVTLVVNKDTLKPDSCELSLGYRFDIAGKINGLPVSAKNSSNKDATFERLDIIKYSDFVY